MRLRTTMLIWIGGPIVVLFFVMAGLVYWNASRMIAAATEREMMALAAYYTEVIDLERMVGHKRACWKG